MTISISFSCLFWVSTILQSLHGLSESFRSGFSMVRTFSGHVGQSFFSKFQVEWKPVNHFCPASHRGNASKVAGKKSGFSSSNLHGNKLGFPSSPCVIPGGVPSGT